MRGGTNQERLFLYDLDELGIKKTDMPNMDQLIARHKSRYHLAAFLARPDMKVLDFPCGSGYGAEILRDVEYTGMDNDDVTIAYANRCYGSRHSQFFVKDMASPMLLENFYDLILCVDGPEHIKIQHHERLMESFYNALKPWGRLLISMPEAELSGPSDTNPHHFGELTYNDFEWLLSGRFTDYHIIDYEDVLHNGTKTNCLYAIARRGK